VPRPARFAYSFYPTTVTPEAYERFNEQPQHDAVAAHTWRGDGDKEPDAAFIYRESRELGVDLVVLHKSTASPHSGRHFELFLFNGREQRVCRQDGTWAPGKWGLAMGDAFVKALGDCLAGGS